MERTKCLTVALALLLIAGGGCSDSNSPPGVTFVALPAALVSQFCVRGDYTVGQTPSGSLAASDCDANDIDPAEVGYFEVFRVRVGQAGAVTFDANSTFDNTLTVLRLDSYTATTANLTELDFNDDRAPGNLNALLTVTLQPNTDYIVAIAGFDYSDVGSYTLQIR